MTQTTTQNALIKAALKRGDALTPQDALRRFGCFRLAARIWDLKEAGLVINKTMIDQGDVKVAEYRLVRGQA